MNQNGQYLLGHSGITQFVTVKVALTVIFEGLSAVDIRSALPLLIPSAVSTVVRTSIAFARPPGVS